LVCDLKLKRTKLHGDQALELICSDPDRFNELRDLGLINEQVSFRQRFFVPSDPDKGISILTELLDRYPIVESDERSEGPRQENLSIDVPASEAKAIVLEQWINPPEQPVDVQPFALVGTEEVPPQEITPTVSVESGVPLEELLEQRAELRSRRQSSPPLTVEGQGLLFPAGAETRAMPESS
jgi:hypothetical protein